MASVLRFYGQDGRSNVLTCGNISPNGKIIGSVGDLYTRNNNGNGELWLKQSGEKSKTGWVQMASGGIGTYGQYMNDALAAGGGVSIGEYYINEATGALTMRLT